MSTATASPKARKPVSRTFRILSRDAAGLTLNITVGRDSDLYRIEPLAADFGTAFTVEKLRSATFLGLDFEEAYHVHTADNGTTCNCPGGTYKGKCKHVDCVLALRQRGKLA